MFESHFGLRENPFVSGHQARFVFPSREHQEALAHLRFGIENREPFVLITGEVGTGKTTALYDALAEWQGRAATALITNSALTRAELIEEICLKFGLALAPPVTKPQALVQLERHLLALRARGERAILLLDEAQNLDAGLLEEIRLLSNLEAQGEKLVQVFLIGQPELEARLTRPELRQLRQRIAVHYRIHPLGPEDTQRYIHHRVSVAGGYAPDVFPADTCEEVWRLTHGIPREVNHVCAQAMLTAFVDDARQVRPEHVRTAATEAQFQSVVTRDDAPAAPEALRGEFARTEPATAPPAVHEQAREAAQQASASREVTPARAAPAPAGTQTGTSGPQAGERWESWLESLATGIEGGEDVPSPRGTSAAAPESPRAARPEPMPPPIARAEPTPAPVEDVAPPVVEEELVSTAPSRGHAPEPFGSTQPTHSDDWRPPLWSARRNEPEPEPEPHSGNSAVRWLVIAVLLAAVTVAGVLAARFRTHHAAVAEQPATSTTAAQTSAPTPTPTTVTPGAETAPSSAVSPAIPVLKSPAKGPVRTAAVPESAAAGRSSAAAASTAGRPARRFGISVGSYMNRDRAESERQRLAGNAPEPVRVVTLHQGGVPMYAIVVGSFETRLAAEEAASDLVKRGVVDEARIVGGPKP